MGQRLVIVAGNVIILAIALLPSAVVTLVAWLITRNFMHSSALLAAATVPAVATVRSGRIARAPRAWARKPSCGLPIGSK